MVGRALRAGDPAGGYASIDRRRKAALRRLVLAEVHERESYHWRLLLRYAVGSLVLAGIGWSSLSDWPSRTTRKVAEAIPDESSGRDRQLQLVAPNGTRVIWRLTANETF